MTMTGYEFTTTMNRVMLAVGVLAQEPIDELLAMVERAETLGPLLEPTAYQRHGHRNLRDQARILHPVAELVRAYKRFEAEAAAR